MIPSSSVSRPYLNFSHRGKRKAYNLACISSFYRFKFVYWQVVVETRVFAFFVFWGRININLQIRGVGVLWIFCVCACLVYCELLPIIASQVFTLAVFGPTREPYKALINTPRWTIQSRHRTINFIYSECHSQAGATMFSISNVCIMELKHWEWHICPPLCLSCIYIFF